MTPRTHSASESPTLFHDPEAPDYQMESVFLSNENYTAAISSMIIVCADTILYNRERRTVYLALRSVHPMMGYWILGGRVRRGEDGWEAMIRLLKTDTGRDFDP